MSGKRKRPLARKETVRSGHNESAQEAPYLIGQDWFAPINKLAGAGRKFNLDLAIATHQARIHVAHGAWMKRWMCEKERPFSLGKAEKLSRIGERLGLLNSLDRASMPSALNVLDVLRKLDRRIIEKLIQKKTITRKTSVNDAKALLEEYNPQAKRKPSPFRVKGWRAQLQRLRDIMKTQGSRTDRAFAIVDYRAAIEDLGNESIRFPREARAENVIQVNAA